jgi:hypothetical protein
LSWVPGRGEARGLAEPARPLLSAGSPPSPSPKARPAVRKSSARWRECQAADHHQGPRIVQARPFKASWCARDPAASYCECVLRVKQSACCCAARQTESGINDRCVSGLCGVVGGALPSDSDGAVFRCWATSMKPSPAWVQIHTEIPHNCKRCLEMATSAACRNNKGDANVIVGTTSTNAATPPAHRHLDVGMCGAPGQVDGLPAGVHHDADSHLPPPTTSHTRL